ncbi:hypothetical protein UFOVP59_63 [uncultured Caudovirales phage]|uniref:Uncharacterized protein n=1 Tax=uncultured Caudovirales phage TaxID=2100421 RepID=A0A6J7WVM0_9CAUD|nr:hypothetical protein UFOVP59_63 [uncultured Caudovirales phage]CAB5220888.1 hypothetical protein UFOVP246_52 [uncultured Caudovirales phage]
MAAHLIPHKMEIATAIRRQIAAGVAMRVILDDIQQYKDSPTSMNTMYKTYRSDIADARARIQEEMGNVVINAARDGDWKAAELFLRSKGGWSPTQTIIEADPEDETSDTGAIDDLLALLGRRKEDKE